MSPFSSCPTMEKKQGNMSTYKKKKETIKKKTRELSILCDIKACAILVGPNGEVDTWPENPTDFNPIIQSYKKNLFDGKRKVKVEDVIDDGCLKKKSKKNFALFCDDGDDQWLDNMSRESKESLLVKLNSKLEAVEKRIEFLKMVNSGNGVVGGSTSSGKEIVLANQEIELWGSSNVAINGDQVTTSRGTEVVGANQENYNSDFEFWGIVGMNGDQLENSTAYNQETEIAMAAEFWGSAGIDQWLDNMSRESKESLLVKLNSKLEAVEKRIEFLKMVNSGNGAVGGSTSSGKEIVLANQEIELWGSSNVAINGDQVTTSRGTEVVGANQENYNSDFEFWGIVGMNGDQLENSTAYNQETEIAMAAEFWGSAGIDQLRDCSGYDDQGQEVGFLGVMPNEMNMWETLNNLENLQNFGYDDDLWPIITGSEFDLLPQEATGFGTLVNQQTLANDSFMAFKPNYDYSIPFNTHTF